MEEDLRRSLIIKEIQNSKLKNVLEETRNELEEVKSQYAQYLDQQTHETTKLEIKIQTLSEDNKKLKDRLNSYTNKKIDHQLQSLKKQNTELKAKLEMISLKNNNELQYLLRNLSKAREENRKLNNAVNNLSKISQDLKSEAFKKDLQIVEITVKLKESLRQTEIQDVLENQLKDFCKCSTNMNSIMEANEENRQRIIDLLRKNKLLTEENKLLKEQNKQILFKHSKQTEEIQNLQRFWGQDQQNILELNNVILHAEKIEENKNEQYTECFTLENKESVEKLHLKIKELLMHNSNLNQKIEDLENSNFQKLKIITKLKLVNESKN